jgi:hypothetical protein
MTDTTVITGFQQHKKEYPRLGDRTREVGRRLREAAS